MGVWKKSNCNMCAQCCGLELEVEDNKIVNVRPDPDNPRSKDYCCRKGRSVKYYQDHGERLNYPLKRVGDKFERVTWDQAVSEIAEKLHAVLDEHGPRSFGVIGCALPSAQGDGPMGKALLAATGSQYFYNPIGLEFMGLLWSAGKALGRQRNNTEPDEERNEALIIWGCNAYVSHQMSRARKTIRKFSEDSERMVIVVDPRLSETARMADMHIALRPGTDALFIRALISLILQEGWQDQKYLDEKTSGLEHILPYYMDFDIKEACRVCGVPYEQTRELGKILTTKKWGMHQDLGVFMGRHSTITSFTLIDLMAVCGMLMVPGGNVVYEKWASAGNDTDDEDPNVWRTVETNKAPVLGAYPTGALPQEILSDNPDRLRALIMSMTDSAHSFPDSKAQKKAYDRLDLMVVIDTCMTETAKHAHYILPATTPYEGYDFGVFQFTYPESFCQLKTPVLKPEGERLEGPEIWLRIGEAMGYIPELPEAMYAAAEEAVKSNDRMGYFMELMPFYLEDPDRLKPVLPFIVGKTLGKAMGSVSKALLWAALMTSEISYTGACERAGYEPGFDMMDKVFQDVIDHPEGVVIGISDMDNNLAKIETPDGKVNLYTKRVFDAYVDITPQKEEESLKATDEFPLIMSAGRHIDAGVNRIMRNPATHKYRKPFTMAINPESASEIGIADGQRVRVVTKAGVAEIEAEYSYQTCKGYVLIPHQFGIEFERQTYGFSVNELTCAHDMDELTGNPTFRYVPCRVEAV